MEYFYLKTEHRQGKVVATMEGLKDIEEFDMDEIMLPVLSLLSCLSNSNGKFSDYAAARSAPS